jgi:hypothetical protein
MSGSEMADEIFAGELSAMRARLVKNTRRNALDNAALLEGIFALEKIQEKLDAARRADEIRKTNP